MLDTIPQASELEWPNCPLCNHSKAIVLYTWPAQHPYRVVRCTACTFTFLSPRPREKIMLALYAQDRYFEQDSGGGYTNYTAQQRALKQTFARLMQQMQARKLTGGRLLEVGCGPGYLLAEARPFFKERHGTDFSPRAANAAAQLADAVFTGGLDDIPSENYYDCIISNHVIEHVYDPGGFVKRLVEKLKPGGCLVLSTPHMGSYWRKLMGRRWPSFKLPEHVLYFEQHGLSSLMTASGLTKPKLLPYLHAFPLSLIMAKLGLSSAGSLSRITAWLPQTTLALWGRKA